MFPHGFCFKALPWFPPSSSLVTVTSWKCKSNKSPLSCFGRTVITATERKPEQHVSVFACQFKHPCYSWIRSDQSPLLIVVPRLLSCFSARQARCCVDVKYDQFSLSGSRGCFAFSISELGFGFQFRSLGSVSGLASFFLIWH